MRFPGVSAEFLDDSLQAGGHRRRSFLYNSIHLSFRFRCTPERASAALCGNHFTGCRSRAESTRPHAARLARISPLIAGDVPAFTGLTILLSGNSSVKPALLSVGGARNAVRPPPGFSQSVPPRGFASRVLHNGP